MTPAQLHATLARAYGRGWQRHFRSFDEIPIAAASIGQVHRATTHDGRDLVLKIQFPGVAKSINSDVDNLAMLLRMTSVLPADFDTRPLLAEVKRQLRRETDYLEEAQSLSRYRAALADDALFTVPRAHADLTTRHILAMDHQPGVPISTLWETPHPQALRDALGTALQRLALREIFELGFVQSDPNFGNYLWSPDDARLRLLDFGSTVEVPALLAARYRRLLQAVLAGDRAAVRRRATELAWLASDERDDRAEGLVDLIVLMCEPILTTGPYDRKLGGTYLLCAQLGARVDTAALARRYVTPRTTRARALRS